MPKAVFFCNFAIMKLTLDSIQIRPIEKNDNIELAQVIRATLKEFGANHPGTVYFDSTTDSLYELFQKPKSFYQVAVYNGQLVGGGGIFPTDGLPEDTCELVKMYLLPNFRGIGLGSRLIQDCLDEAAALNFKRVYLESMPELKKALTTYEKFGFTYLDGPIGNTGHFGCALWMLKTL